MNRNNFFYIIILLTLVMACSSPKPHDKTPGAKMPVDKTLQAKSLQSEVLISSEKAKMPDLNEIHEITMDLTLQPAEYRVSHRVVIKNAFDQQWDKLYIRTLMNAMGGALTLSSSQINGTDRQAEYDPEDNSYCSFSLENPLQPGESLELTMDYHSTIPEAKPPNSRLFSWYNQYLMMDYFYPSIVLPFKGKWKIHKAIAYGDLIFNQAAFFELQITCPKELSFATTGKIIESIQIDDKRKQLKIVSGPARGFFMAASPKWVSLSQTIGETELIVYGPRELENQLKTCVDLASKALEYFSSLLLPYPYKELEIVFLDADSSAMEFPGMIAMGINYLHNMEAMSKEISFRSYELILVHELIHQWFFNILGNDQINEPWIDEGFTQYMLYYYYRNFYGEQRAAECLAFFSFWEKRVNTETSITEGVASYSNGSLYTGAIYGKAPLFLHKIDEQVGSAQFIQFAQSLLKKYHWNILDTESFITEAKGFFNNQCDPILNKYLK